MTTTPAQISLSDLSSLIDMPAFYAAHGAAFDPKKTANSRAEGKEYSAPCPRCGGDDRFKFWDSGRFHCLRGCGWHGSSPYYFLRDQGYSHFQTCTELNLDMDLVGYNGAQKTLLPLELIDDEPPCKQWMEAAAAFCSLAERYLLSEHGQSARNYIHSRGLKDEIIKQARLGLCPGWFSKPCTWWGIQPEQMPEGKTEIKIPAGIVIPWYQQNDIWKIQIRRPQSGRDGKSYVEVTGSCDQVLYNVNAFRPGKPVMLVESELDCLSVQQEAGELVACVATGGAGKRPFPRAVADLWPASVVLQGFDNDENHAGDDGADAWIRRFPAEKIIRWRPSAHDYNEMLQNGQNIQSWIANGLQYAAPWPTEPEPPAVEQEPELQRSTNLDKFGRVIPDELIERVHAFQTRPCISCSGFDWMIDYDGLLVCTCIVARRDQAALPRPKVASRNITTGIATYWQQ